MNRSLRFYISLFFVLLVMTFVHWNFLRKTPKDSLPVITYHSINDVNPEDNEYILEFDAFEKMVKGLADEDFTFLSLEEFESIVYKKMAMPKNPILITFDDGYEDNYSIAYPILKKYNAKSAIFIIGSYVGRDGFLDWDQIQEMAESGLVSFGNHSFNLHDLFLDGPNKGKTFMSAKLEGESDEHYYQKILDDLIWNNSLIYERSSIFPSCIAYPGSMVNDSILKATCDSGLKIGFIGANKAASRLDNIDPYKIKRFHINKNTDIDKMIRFLKRDE